MGAVGRRDAIRWASAAACGLQAAATAAAELPGRPPNLVFLFSDQQSWDMVGYESPQVRTPNLDRMAAEGARFRHCVSSCPVCTPYRGMLLTGQHPLRNGAIANDAQLLTGAAIGFGEALRRAGYRTGYFGKWHLYGGDRVRPIPPGPHRHGFDDFLSNNCTVEFRPGHAYYWDRAGRRVVYDQWEPYGQTDQALEFLEGCDRNTPYALFVSWHWPHDHTDRRYDTDPDLMALYDPSRLALRPSVIDTPTVRRMMHGYLAMVSGLDRCVGRILARLRDRGDVDNTLVVYTSDHGDQLHSHQRLRPKTAPEDPSCRVPLVMRYPGSIPAGSSQDTIVGTLDLMPTILGLLGVRRPSTCEGRDLSGAVRSGAIGGEPSAPLLMPHLDWRGVYTRQYTYAFDLNDETQEPSWNVLYDRRQDPHQTRNLYYSAQHRDLRNRLHRLAVRWLERLDDPFWSWSQTRRACGFPEQMSARGIDCVAPGRPMDVLLAQRVSGFRDRPLPTAREDRTRARLAIERARMLEERFRTM